MVWNDLDQIIGVSGEQACALHALSAAAQRQFPAKFDRLRGYFAAHADEDRKKLSYLFHNFRPAHEAERLTCLEHLLAASRQTADAGPWAVLFLYYGWGHLMVKRIERRLAEEQRIALPPAPPSSAFVYTMF